jgi:hypothetical protein
MRFPLGDRAGHESTEFVVHQLLLIEKSQEIVVVVGKSTASLQRKGKLCRGEPD